MNPERRKLWVLALNRKNFVPKNYAVICSDHFTENDYDRNKLGGSWLKSDALPSRFPKQVENVNSNISTTEIRPKDNENVSHIPKIKVFRYLGDFKDDDDELTGTDRLRWELANKRILRQQMKIRSLCEVKRRLETKVTSLRKTIAELKNEKLGKISVQEECQKEKVKKLEADFVFDDETSSNESVPFTHSESNFIEENS